MTFGGCAGPTWVFSRRLATVHALRRVQKNLRKAEKLSKLLGPPVLKRFEAFNDHSLIFSSIPKAFRSGHHSGWARIVLFLSFSGAPRSSFKSWPKSQHLGII